MEPKFFSSTDFADLFEVVIRTARRGAQRARNLFELERQFSSGRRNPPEMESTPSLYQLEPPLPTSCHEEQNARRPPTAEHEPWRSDRLFPHTNAPRETIEAMNASFSSTTRYQFRRVADQSSQNLSILHQWIRSTFTGDFLRSRC